MKALIILLLIPICGFGQHQYEILKQDEVGLLKCSYIRGINGNNGRESYNAVVMFRNMDYYVDSCEISLADPVLLEQFKTDLRACVDYLVQKKKDKSQLVHTCMYYSLVIHDFPNFIYLYDHQMGYTRMTLRESQALLYWLSSLES